MSTKRLFLQLKQEFVHLLDRSPRCRLEGNEPLLLSGVRGLHGRCWGVLNVLLLLWEGGGGRHAVREKECY